MKPFLIVSAFGWTPLTDTHIINGWSFCRRLEADTKRELEDRIKDAQKRGNTKID